MKRKLLLGTALLSLIIAACINPIFPEKKEKGIPSETSVISIGGSNLSDVECVEGEEIELTVSVEGDEDDYTYQWYKNDENSNEDGEPIPGATGPTFKPPTDEEGTTYYYVVVKNKKNGKTTTSNPIKVTVNPDVPVISVDGSDKSEMECTEGDDITLTAGIKGDEDDYTYQWYKNDENSNENGILIPGANDPTFKPPTDEEGETYYYVVIKNKKTGKETASNPIKVTVDPKVYSIVVDIIDNESGDTVTASPDKGNDGNTVTLTYSVANTALYNLLNFGGVTSEITSVNSAGNGTRTYTINAADASSGIITITAVFEHTDLIPDQIAFTDTAGHITKTYGDAVFTNAVKAGHNGSGAITYSSSNTTVAVVDSSGQVTIHKVGSAVISAEKEADAVYAHAQVEYTLAVNPKPVTITGLSVSNKVYDGTTTATVTGTAVISGKISTDTVTVSAGTAAFANSSVGNGKTVTFSGWTLTGADAGNYTLSAQPVNVTANITAKPVTITGLSVSNKVYDGTTTATVTGTAVISGKIGTDTVTVSAGTAAFANASVGHGKTVTFSGWSLTGADAGNYSLSAQPASVTAYISYIDVAQIPAGTFTMGSPAGEPNRYSDEGPQHSVTLSGFYMGKYQVTQEQYQIVMGSNPSNFKSAVAGESGTPGKLPVETVSWYDALVFCNKLSMMEGLSPAYSISGSTDPAAWGTVPTSSNTTWNAVVIVSGSNGYRLPTEAQWEYACRAGTTTAYNTGAAISDYTGCYTSNSGSKTHQVGLKSANYWGLYDMHGNVWEWCWDWYGENYYSSSPANNPMGASSGASRVRRGGSWDSSAENLRSAYRVNSYPHIRGGSIGFRLVRP
jgi:formylglycine-generating enzyme required for sulfatase activity